jgi:two-component system cell cycle sensor histidine kinase/response regulator CckA
MLGTSIRLTVLRANEPCFGRVDTGHLRWVVFTLAAFAHRRADKVGALVIEVDAVDLGAFDTPTRHGVPPGSYVRVRFTDDGVALSEREVAGLFQPDGESDRDPPGLGTLDRVVRAHGGRIDVMSRTGRGTRFVLHLPRLQGVELDAALEVSAQLPR